MGVQASVSLGTASGARRARVCTWVSQKMAFLSRNSKCRCHQGASGMLMGGCALRLHCPYVASVRVCVLFYAPTKPHLTIKPNLQQSLIRLSISTSGSMALWALRSIVIQNGSFSGRHSGIVSFNFAVELKQNHSHKTALTTTVAFVQTNLLYWERRSVTCVMVCVQGEVPSRSVFLIVRTRFLKEKKRNKLHPPSICKSPYLHITLHIVIYKYFCIFCMPLIQSYSISVFFFCHCCIDSQHDVWFLGEGNDNN